MYYNLMSWLISDLAKEAAIPSSEDIFSSTSVENVSRDEKIHRMHLLRMKLIYFANSLHNYIMTRVSRSMNA